MEPLGPSLVTKTSVVLRVLKMMVEGFIEEEGSEFTVLKERISLGILTMMEKSVA